MINHEGGGGGGVLYLSFINQHRNPNTNTTKLAPRRCL
jgi:hypothetical protein